MSAEEVAEPPANKPTVRLIADVSKYLPWMREARDAPVKKPLGDESED